MVEPDRPSGNPGLDFPSLTRWGTGRDGSRMGCRSGDCRRGRPHGVGRRLWNHRLSAVECVDQKLIAAMEIVPVSEAISECEYKSRVFPDLWTDFGFSDPPECRSASLYPARKTLKF